MNFKEWLLLSEDAHAPGGKFGLYPHGYGGIGLCTPADWTPSCSDAITYMPKDYLNFRVTPGFKPLPNANHDDIKYAAVQYKIPPDTSTNADNR